MKSIKSSNDLHNLERGNILVIVPHVMFGNDPDIISKFFIVKKVRLNAKYISRESCETQRDVRIEYDLVFDGNHESNGEFDSDLLLIDKPFMSRIVSHKLELTMFDDYHDLINNIDPYVVMKETLTIKLLGEVYKQVITQ